ncbi:MAG: FIST C-terminal domain-containing protein [Bacteroidetes bacterium]|nr:FIST C-terminal domain-containing protein [Bacteroidota bacterium]
MKIEQCKWTPERTWETLRSDLKDAEHYQLVIVFGSRILLSSTGFYQEIRNKYPKADILMNSTSGEIFDTQVNDDTISLTAICFEKTKFITHGLQFSDYKDSKLAGIEIAKKFDHNQLTSILIISDGQQVNGSDLVSGLQQELPKEIVITGGLAGDGNRFQKTLVGLNEQPEEGQIIAVGFYGSHLKVSHGSMGGWDAFGPERLITKSTANVLFELDGQPALSIYKKYLGEFSDELPGSALLFPLSVKLSENDEPVVRTILSINEDEQSLTFAGNVPTGTYTRLMKANFDRLIEGASNAATHSIQTFQKPDLAILISCVGRKLVLNQRIEEEVEAIRDILGTATAITGFYSYGEISPNQGFNSCELHNQTMTITTMSER